MDDSPPRLPGYGFVRRLGSGTTADVHLYRRQDTPLHVAVKVSRTRLDDAMAARFRAEADALRRLARHPYVLPVRDCALADDGRGYLVLDYAPGGSYKDRMLGGGPLHVEQVLGVGVRLAGAVADAHRLGIIHRDIKPANVLIGARGQPLLADFGIAAEVYRAGEPTGRSTPWAAPEVVAGATGGNEASDLYALGATLFGLLAGTSPFQHGRADVTPRQLDEAIVNGLLLPLGRADVPECVERALRRAMARIPDDRYGSAVAFARALQRIEQRRFGRVTPLVAHAAAPYPPGLDAHDDCERRGHGNAPTPRRQGQGDAEPHAEPHMISRRTPESGCREPDARPTSATAMAPSSTTTTAPPSRRVMLMAGCGVMAALIVTLSMLVFVLRPDHGGEAPQPAMRSGASNAGGPDDTGGAEDADDGGSADGDAADDAADGTTDGPDAALRGDAVPPVEQLRGIYDGDTVVFTWRNPAPQQGDSYAWAPVDDTADEYGAPDAGLTRADMHIVHDETVTISAPGTNRTCIQVNLVRADRRMSSDTPISCALRR